MGALPGVVSFERSRWRVRQGSPAAAAHVTGVVRCDAKRSLITRRVPSVVAVAGVCRVWAVIYQRMESTT